MKKQIVGVLWVVATVSSIAQAAVEVDGMSRTGSPLRSATPINVSDSSYVYKMAVIEGQEAAVLVLNGEEASDLFVRAKEAAEQMLQIPFESDREAAIAIIELGQQISE